MRPRATPHAGCKEDKEGPWFHLSIEGASWRTDHILSTLSIVTCLFLSGMMRFECSRLQTGEAQANSVAQLPPSVHRRPAAGPFLAPSPVQLPCFPLEWYHTASSRRAASSRHRRAAHESAEKCPHSTTPMAGANARPPPPVTA